MVTMITMAICNCDKADHNEKTGICALSLHSNNGVGWNIYKGKDKFSSVNHNIHARYTIHIAMEYVGI